MLRIESRNLAREDRRVDDYCLDLTGQDLGLPTDKLAVKVYPLCCPACAAAAAVMMDRLTAVGTKNQIKIIILPSAAARYRDTIGMASGNALR